MNNSDTIRREQFQIIYLHTDAIRVATDDADRAEARGALVEAQEYRKLARFHQREIARIASTIARPIM